MRNATTCCRLTVSFLDRRIDSGLLDQHPARAFRGRGAGYAGT
ncbi:hypothetical protein [Amycolatopsis coloradensis]|nr:hypothetical protein [Amycolatopsis coloradensis]